MIRTVYDPLMLAEPVGFDSDALARTHRARWRLDARQLRCEPVVPRVVESLERTLATAAYLTREAGTR